MMKWTMLKAWLLGAAVLVVAHAMWWGVAAGIDRAEGLRVILFIFPVLAAFLVTYLSPSRKIALGMSMGIFGAVVGMFAMFLYEQLGYHVDQIGGPIATISILLAVHLAYAFAGTVIGYLAVRFRSKRLSS